MMLCCNLNSDYGPHRGYVLGNLDDGGFLDLYFGGPAMRQRRRLLGFGPKKGCCEFCLHTVLPDSWILKAMVGACERKTGLRS